MAAPVTVGRVEGAVALGDGEVEISAEARDGGIAASAGQTAVAVGTYIKHQIVQPPSPVRRPTVGLPLEAVPAGFIDRAELSGPVEALLAGGGSPAVLLHGMAGSGKTLLARRVAERVAGRFGGGVLYLRLGGEQQPTLTAGDALGRLLAALGVDGENIPEALADRELLYRSKLAERDVLVVLDNAAHAEQVAPLLPRVAGCAALVTSRDTLAGLGGALQRVAVEELTVAQGVALLERRLSTERVAGEHDDAVQLVELCARLALAVALAAGPLTTRQRRPLAAVVTALAKEGARLDPVRATFQLSYETLNADQARIFRLLGLLDIADVDVELAAVLADLPAERAGGLLEELVDRSLVQPAGDRHDRYRLHDLLRLYARELLDREEPRALQRDLVDRVAGWYQQQLTAADAWLGVAGQRGRFANRAEALAWLDTQRRTLVAVIGHTADRQLHNRTITLAAHLGAYLELGVFRRDALHVAEQAVDAAGHLKAVPLEALTLNNLGLALVQVRRFDEAIAAYQQALDRKREAGDRHGEGRTLNNLGNALREVRRFDEAIAAYQQALDRKREAGDEQRAAQVEAELSTLQNCRPSRSPG